VSEIKDSLLVDPAALVGSNEPANDHIDIEIDDGGVDLHPSPRGRARGPVRASPRPYEAPTTEVISRKEHARLLRRQAYQRAKQLRATDPRHLALKEALKQRRRAAYQAVKAKRKAAAAEQKSAEKAARERARSSARKASSEGLLQQVKRGADVAKLPLRRRPPPSEE
jgi:hypothetical protein